MNRLLVILAALVAAPIAFAQDGGDEENREIRYKAKTEIDFEDVDVTGDLVKPEGQLLLDRKRASFNPLIKLRQDFNEEMRQSIDEVK